MQDHVHVRSPALPPKDALAELHILLVHLFDEETLVAGASVKAVEIFRQLVIHVLDEPRHDQVLGRQVADPAFGVLLDASNVDARWAELQAQLALYRQQHPEEVQALEQMER